MSRLINIGFGNMVNAAKIVAIISPDSAPSKRIVQNAKDEGRAIDATQGRRTRAVIIMTYPLCSRRQLPDGIRDGIFRNN